MSWRDRLFDASFKGIPFKVSSHDYKGGRRTQTHNFANREKPYTQDNGSQSEEFEIEAYIIQNLSNEFDHFSERDNLIRVLRQKGPGTLIDPFLGSKKVNVTGFTLKETFDEGGIAKFTISFIETGERALPTALNDFITKIDNAVNAAMDKIGDEFNKIYSTATLFQDFASNTISRSIGTIQSAITLTSGINTKIINESLGNLAIIRNSVLDIINSPSDIFNAMKNSCYAMASICGMGSVLLAEQTLKGFTTGNEVSITNKIPDIFASKISISTNITGGETGIYSGVVRGNVITLDPNNINETLGRSVIKNMTDIISNFDMTGFGAVAQNQETNVALILDTFKFLIISTVCRIAMRIDFFSQENLFETLNQINQIIDRTLLDLGDEAAKGSYIVGIGSGTTPINNKDIFIAIQDIRKTFMDNMEVKSSFLTRTIDYRINVDTQTTLELAYEKYNDLSRANEIFLKNRSKIKHPGFMPNNQIIRVLNE